MGNLGGSWLRATVIKPTMVDLPKTVFIPFREIVPFLYARNPTEENAQRLQLFLSLIVRTENVSFDGDGPDIGPRETRLYLLRELARTANTLLKDVADLCRNKLELTEMCSSFCRGIEMCGDFRELSFFYRNLPPLVPDPLGKGSTLAV